MVLREPLRAMALGTRFEAEELGFFAPTRRESGVLEAGEVGYVITGLKDVSRLRVGDTIRSIARTAVKRAMRDGGVVIEEHAIVDQRGDTLQHGRFTFLVAKRPAA